MSCQLSHNGSIKEAGEFGQMLKNQMFMEFFFEQHKLGRGLRSEEEISKTLILAF